ncbi:hypothetical protein OHA57_00100 [Streptomyces anulatus]|uniref:hypothetical protein n=1 Tax=Streptomyces anulatus TaxID=1892 RepID=UPI002DD9DCA0|nr:hypothetical protein [Streptomyces anulatus]WSC59230.1 hypothetical protein OHA57_00100 [Streptomyces anulatus]
MPTYVETNVWLPACALAAVKAIAVRRGLSRDETVRQLLDEHLEAQEHREPDMRLTHISTVLRYPPALGRRKHRWVPEFGGPLRLRLHPGVADRARTVSLRLPGQFQRAHRDYQSRQLTDAVMTAIAVHESFTDTYLDGLWPVLRHRAARGLWGLAVVATSTAPELAVHEAVSRAEFPDEDGSATGASAGGPGASSRLLRVAAALEGETSWHSAVRFWVAANIARLLLTGPGRDAAERMLFEQGEQWRELRLDYRYANAATREELRRGIGDWDDSGRGGGAVWRAERAVEVEDFEVWLVARGRAAERMNLPPGWLVRTPPTWRVSAVGGHGAALREPYAGWVVAGRLLVFTSGGTPGVWPLTRENGGRMRPVEGIEPVVAAAAGLAPAQASTFIEAMLVDWSDDGEADLMPVPAVLRLPASQAYDFGYIDAAQRSSLMAQARVATLESMNDVLNHLHDDFYRARLEAARDSGSVTDFRRLARWARVHFSPSPATWPWPGGPVAHEVVAGTRPEIVHWLATHAHRTTATLLQHSMGEAWNAAFDHRRPSFWTDM